MSEEIVNRTVECLQEIASTADAVTDMVSKLRPVNTAKGISLLDVKSQTMLGYLIDMTCIVDRKVQGQTIEGDPAIERLVEARTVLEKIRPIEQKLKYQIDKLCKAANMGQVQDGILQLRPNPSTLLNKLEDESEKEDNEDGEEETASKLYRPPKLAAVPYTLDESANERKTKQQERAKKRALSSSLMRELQEEYSEGPLEIQETVDVQRRRLEKKREEREKYEEDYFIRMNVTKRERHEEQRMRSGSNLDYLTRFDNMAALDEDGSDQDGMPKRKKSKLQKKGKGKKGRGGGRGGSSFKRRGGRKRR